MLAIANASAQICFELLRATLRRRAGWRCAGSAFLRAPRAFGTISFGHLALRTKSIRFVAVFSVGENGPCGAPAREQHTSEPRRNGGCVPCGRQRRTGAALSSRSFARAKPRTCVRALDSNRVASALRQWRVGVSYGDERMLTYSSKFRPPSFWVVSPPGAPCCVRKAPCRVRRSGRCTWRSFKRGWRRSPSARTRSIVREIFAQRSEHGPALHNGMG